MEKFETTIFDNKTFSGLMSDIYKNANEKKAQINALIMELKPLIKDVQNATILVPLIADYLEVSVRNDEQLVKLAAIAQRVISSNEKDTKDISMLLTQEEKDFLLTEAKKPVEIENKNDKEIKKLKDK